MTEEFDKPVRNKFRFGAKIIEWIAALSIVAIIIENLGFVESVSSIVAMPARKVTDVLPNLVDIVAHIPFPNFITQAIAGTKMAQDFNLLLNLAALWAVAKLIATIFRLVGAERSKAENIFGIVIKGVILLAFLSEGVKLAMGSETIDLFKGLIPLSMKNGGDVPGWLSNNNLRELAWVVSSAISGLLVGVWAYRSNIRPGRLMRQEAEELELSRVFDVPETSEVPEVPEASKVEDAAVIAEVTEEVEVTEAPEVPEISETPEVEEVSEVAEAAEAPETPEESQ